MALLENEEIESGLESLPDWRRDGDAIERQFELENFMGSVRFINALAEPAEEMNHHPDLEVAWNKVTVTLSTHSEGGLTVADFELAEKIDQLA